MLALSPSASDPSVSSQGSDSTRGLNDMMGGMADWVVGAIARPFSAIEETASSQSVAAMFETDPGLFALAILRLDGSLGLIDRSGILTQFARRYGRELYEKKPISALMDKAPLIVDAFDPASSVSERIAGECPKALAAGFIVTDGGRYLGVASGIDLVRLQSRQLVTTVATLNDAQKDLVQAEKMASLGQLVAGIAHEINTPIGIGLTAASHLREATDKFDQLFLEQKLKRSDLEYYVGVATESADMIQANIDRAAHLIQSFKQVAVDQTSGERRRFNLADHLDDVLVSLRPELKNSPHKISVDCPDAIFLDSFPGALAQVYTNLIMNALVHAFSADQPGVLTLIARSSDGEAIITLADDGKGIAPEHLPKIYDPFFTTRRGQGGSGLGLHIVFNIVTTTLRGRLACRSTLGEGTTFTLKLPLSIDGAAAS